MLYKEQELIYTVEIKHNQALFKKLFPFLQRNKVELVFETTGVYSKQLEDLFETNGFNYYCLNPLEVSSQTPFLDK